MITFGTGRINYLLSIFVNFSIAFSTFIFVTFKQPFDNFSLKNCFCVISARRNILKVAFNSIYKLLLLMISTDRRILYTKKVRRAAR